MKFFEDKISSKYTPKRTKLHHLKFFWGGMPPNPPSKAHGFAMRSMSLRDMQSSKSEKNISCPPPSQILGTPLHYVEFVGKCTKVNTNSLK